MCFTINCNFSAKPQINSIKVETSGESEIKKQNGSSTLLGRNSVRNKYCKICDMNFKYYYETSAHTKTHPNKYSAVPVRRAVLLRSRIKEKALNKLYSCRRCNVTTRHYSACLFHVKMCTKRRYQCTLCPRSFNTRKFHKLHHLSHKQVDINLYRCEMCSRKFKHASVLLSHAHHVHSNILSIAPPTMKVESDDVIQCEKCGEHFRNQMAYCQHARTHDVLTSNNNRSLLRNLSISQLTDTQSNLAWVSRGVGGRNLCNVKC